MWRLPLTCRIAYLNAVFAFDPADASAVHPLSAHLAGYLFSRVDQFGVSILPSTPDKAFMLASALAKCVPVLLMPLGLAVLILLASLRSRRRALILLPIVILCVFGTPMTSDLVMRTLEDHYPFRIPGECPPSDSIFVFGGMLGLRDHGNAKPDWNGAAERFDEAITLQKSGKAPLIVFSGGPERYEGGPTEGEILRAEAIRRGVPGNSILVTQKTWNTESEARNLCALARQRDWTRVILVTSAYHMPRAALLSASCKVELVPMPVAYETPAPDTSWAYRRPEYYLLQGQALATSGTALHEYWGILLYRLFKHD